MFSRLFFTRIFLPTFYFYHIFIFTLIFIFTTFFKSLANEILPVKFQNSKQRPNTPLQSSASTLTQRPTTASVSAHLRAYTQHVWRILLPREQ